MSGSLVSFHLAYVPAAGLKNSISNGDDSGDGPVIRRASSLRLYRCRSHHRKESNGEEEHFCTDNSAEKSPADTSDQLSDEECHCCCCRAERCPSDSMPPFQSSFDLTTTNCGVNSPLLGEANMLAVLVPSALTRSIVNIASRHMATNGKMEQIDTKNNSLEERNVKHQIIDAEIELRKSIHPGLCPDGTKHPILSDGVKSNENRGKINDQLEKDSPTPFNFHQLFVCGIITSNDVSNCTNFPADVVLLAPKNIPPPTNFADRQYLISHYSNMLNHETASNAPWSVIKAFPISKLSIFLTTSGTNNEIAAINRNEKTLDIAALPCCPVCLNLIEPTRLGLPELKPHHKCSRWCSSSNDCHKNNFSQQHSCGNETKFLPWPPPAECTACKQRDLSMESHTSGPRRSLSMESSLSLSPVAPRATLQRKDTDQPNHDNNSVSLSNSVHPQTSPNPLICHQCTMSTTLWVCLTCGVVGCGRYTLKHAAQHYTLEGHPYSLELATGRIWDYENGNFVHRRDLVECPVLSMKWGIGVAGGESTVSPSQLVASSLSGNSFQEGDINSFSENDNNLGWRKEGSGDDLNQNPYDGLENSIASCRSNHNQATPTEASKLSAQPKKSIMISQEYEVLLQSALEDQSQHYEGEISHLRAELASSRMQDTPISDRESREIHALQNDSERLKQDVEQLSAALLEAQTKEAKHRSKSQRMLREQSISKELLEKIRKETLTEHESGKQRMEDLEMQISDLTANLRMMSQFAENEELSQAQIFGTIGGEEKGKKQRGKKSRRGRKKG
ncbi:hypothetical protein ACHAXR_006605 [Thalassiosira sp. AJA248-18]